MLLKILRKFIVVCNGAATLYIGQPNLIVYCVFSLAAPLKLNENNEIECIWVIRIIACFRIIWFVSLRVLCAS